MLAGRLLFTVILATGHGALAGNTSEVRDLYVRSCSSCHDSGAEGAPRPGVASDWSDRLSYGVEELYISAIEGAGPAMPPRGLCFECSDEQLRAIVDFMIRGL